MINILKKTVVVFVALNILTVAYLPTIGHAFSHLTSAEVIHGHDDDAHQHEHDTSHHEVSLLDVAPAIITQTNKTLIQKSTNRDVFKVHLFLDETLSPSVNQGYTVAIQPPRLRSEQLHLYSHLANAPPV